MAMMVVMDTGIAGPAVTRQSQKSQRDLRLGLAVENHVAGAPCSHAVRHHCPVARRHDVHDHGVTRNLGVRDHGVWSLGQDVRNHVRRHCRNHVTDLGHVLRRKSHGLRRG